MRIRIPFAAIIISAPMLAFGVPSPSGALPSAPRFLKIDEAATMVHDVRHRRRGARFYVPIAPNYSAYDYPYYDARGHYPTHIAPGYMYYGRPYASYAWPYAYYARPYAPYRHRGFGRRGSRAGRY